MEQNKYQWNKTLKFSWSHIFAFISIVFISYISYMGEFYANGGDLKKSAIIIGIIDVSLLTTFIGAQLLKSTEKKFNKCIIIERILIFLSPIIFTCCLIPYNNFWGTYSQRENIKNQFELSINDSKKIFDKYEEYANERINNYVNSLKNNNYDKDKIKAYKELLELQLLSKNTKMLKEEATNWLNIANNGNSIWNAFLIGNITIITNAISSWTSTLQSWSQNRLSNEPEYPEFNDNNAIKDFEDLQNMYKETHGISINTIWTGIILFILLLFPYIFQERDTRARGLYSLISNKKQEENCKNTVKNKTKKSSSDNTSTNISSNKLDNDNIYGGTF